VKHAEGFFVTKSPVYGTISSSLAGRGQFLTQLFR
jgi:hypothetical protein